jgi:hypothetical protein
MKDLFETPELMPSELKAILDAWEERFESGLSYQDLADMLKQVESIGFTFDYYLDATPYNLRAI